MSAAFDNDEQTREPGTPRRCKLPKAARLRTQQHFRRVYGRGLRRSGALMTVIGFRSNGGHGARLGVSVSKDHGPAVRRNKIKRLLREAFRLERAAMAANLDVVLIPRRNPDKLRLEDLRAELVTLIGEIERGKGNSRRPRSRR